MGKKIIAFGVVFLLSFVLISISNGTNGEYIGTETQITDSVEDQIYPAIYGDRIVWSGLYGGTRDIFVYNLSTNIEMRITRDIAGDFYPTIFGDIIVWYKIDGANSNIYMYNISNNTEIQITNDPADQRNPAIYGDRIVWDDWRNGNSDIYMYNISTNTETQITNPTGQYHPAILSCHRIWLDGIGQSDLW